MARMVIVRKSGWHCAVSKACVFESLGPGWRVAGTNTIVCGTHRPMIEAMQYARGRECGETSAVLSLRTNSPYRMTSAPAGENVGPRCK